MIIRFTHDADVELLEARQWYARQREDLEFMELIDDALSRVVRGPGLDPIVYRNLRREKRCTQTSSTVLTLR